MAGSSKKRKQSSHRPKARKLGIIAEDNNDIAVIDELTRKFIKETQFSISPFIGRGCGKLRRKCKSWAGILLQKGCEHLIIVHDLDRNDELSLREELEAKIKDLGFKKSIVLIPTEELEAWLLTDANAIKTVFNMKCLPKVPRHPEKVQSPKEYLGQLVRNNAKAQYLNTVHNQRIARELCVSSLDKCPSFSTLPDFLLSVFPQKAQVARTT
ncbi:MAG: DUF4276 family protein [Planctomycetota bacterium]